MDSVCLSPMGLFRDFSVLSAVSVTSQSVRPKKKKSREQIFFKFPRAPPNTLPHHSFSLISLSLWPAHSLPFFPFFHFLSTQHKHLSHTPSSSPTVPTPIQHLHHHFSRKITRKFLRTYKHLHILFLR